MNDLIIKTAVVILSSMSLGMNGFAEQNRLVDSRTPESSAPKGCKLVFSDEFNGVEVDRSKWHLGLDKKNIQNVGVSCAYRWENISLRKGHLVFVQQREETPIHGKTWASTDGAAFDYTSGSLNTAGIFEFTQNMYVEIRVKLPENSGGYAAFWGMAGKQGSRPEDYLELDIFEYISNPNQKKFWSGLWWHDFSPDELGDYVPESDVVKRSDTHYFVNNQEHKGHFQPEMESVMAGVNCDDFITVGFVVSETKMEWYLSEKGSPLKSEPYMTFEGGEIHSPAYAKGTAPKDCWERHVPTALTSSLILNYAMRDFKWAGGPIDEAHLPAEMLIDYIRVYQKNTEQF